MTNEEIVLHYISTHTHDPLFFDGHYDLDVSNLDLGEIIFEILKISRLYNSCRKIDNQLIRETWANSYRSSIDIWRHIIAIRPEVTIFEVMRKLWEIKNRLYGQYCYDVHRRVFKNKYEDCEYSVDSYYTDDEYCLLFNDWRRIGLNEN